MFDSLRLESVSLHGFNGVAVVGFRAEVCENRPIIRGVRYVTGKRLNVVIDFGLQAHADVQDADPSIVQYVTNGRSRQLFQTFFVESRQNVS
jgi:hypothetical protein